MKTLGTTSCAQSRSACLSQTIFSQNFQDSDCYLNQPAAFVDAFLVCGVAPARTQSTVSFLCVNGRVFKLRPHPTSSFQQGPKGGGRGPMPISRLNLITKCTNPIVLMRAVLLKSQSYSHFCCFLANNPVPSARNCNFPPKIR